MPATPPWVFVIVRSFYHIPHAKSRLTSAFLSWAPLPGQTPSGRREMSEGGSLDAPERGLRGFILNHSSALFSASGASAAAIAGANPISGKQITGKQITEKQINSNQEPAATIGNGQRTKKKVPLLRNLFTY